MLVKQAERRKRTLDGYTPGAQHRNEERRKQNQRSRRRGNKEETYKKSTSTNGPKRTAQGSPEVPPRADMPPHFAALAKPREIKRNKGEVAQNKDPRPVIVKPSRN